MQTLMKCNIMLVSSGSSLFEKDPFGGFQYTKIKLSNNKSLDSKNDSDKSNSVG